MQEANIQQTFFDAPEVNPRTCAPSVGDLTRNVTECMGVFAPELHPLTSPTDPFTPDVIIQFLLSAIMINTGRINAMEQKIKAMQIGHNTVSAHLERLHITTNEKTDVT